MFGVFPWVYYQFLVDLTHFTTFVRVASLALKQTFWLCWQMFFACFAICHAMLVFVFSLWSHNVSTTPDSVIISSAHIRGAQLTCRWDTGCVYQNLTTNCYVIILTLCILQILPWHYYLFTYCLLYIFQQTSTTKNPPSIMLCLSYGEPYPRPLHLVEQMVGQSDCSQVAVNQGSHQTK